MRYRVVLFPRTFALTLVAAKALLKKSLVAHHAHCEKQNLAMMSSERIVLKNTLEYRAKLEQMVCAVKVADGLGFECQIQTNQA